MRTKLLTISTIGITLALAAGCERQRTGSGSQDDEENAPKVVPQDGDDTVTPRQGDLREGTAPYSGAPDTAATTPIDRRGDTTGQMSDEPGTGAVAPNGSPTMSGTGTDRGEAASGAGASGGAGTSGDTGAGAGAGAGTGAGTGSGTGTMGPSDPQHDTSGTDRRPSGAPR
ncbi:MAG TPA: hypothetical protein VMZ28_04050 [Kofleriaceae bacterium]|nr:hypothetical protein [Kofleriaceae bacterium]